METTEIVKVNWLPKAEIEYYNILLYWIENNQTESYSERIEEEVRKITFMLRRNPKIGTIVDNNYNLRRVIVLRNYSMYYHIIEETQTIEILSFWDNRNNPKKLNLNRI